MREIRGKKREAKMKNFKMINYLLTILLNTLKLICNDININFTV